MVDEVTDYVIVEGTAEELKTLVGDLLKDGWIPHGGVAMASAQPGNGALECVFAQAMVRVSGYRKSLAVTVPLVAPGSTGPTATATVAMPGAPSADSVIACPHCRIAIPMQQLKNGKNKCQKCQREFMVEWGV